MTLIPVTAIVNPTTIIVPRNKKKAFWLSLKTNMGRPSIIVRRSGCILSSEVSGTTISTQVDLLKIGPLRVPVFATSSETQLKKNFPFYVFVLGGGRSRCCGRITTTVGSGRSWLGNLRRQLLVLVTRTMVASTSERSPQNLWIPMNRLTHLDQRK